MTNTNQIEELLSEYQVIPVVTLATVEHALPLADALASGGLPIIEITFRTDAAEAGIRAISQRGDILVCAGTILTAEQADRAQEAGASFVFSPGLSSRVVRHCQKIDLPIIPGVCSPTEIERAIEHGLQVAKFFPAEAFGGVKTLAAISGPYPRMQLIPTGGITLENVKSYLAHPQVLACGGSWLTNSSLYANGDFEPVKKAAQRVLATIR